MLKHKLKVLILILKTPILSSVTVYKAYKCKDCSDTLCEKHKKEHHNKLDEKRY